MQYLFGFIYLGILLIFLLKLIKKFFDKTKTKNIFVKLKPKLDLIVQYILKLFKYLIDNKRKIGIKNIGIALLILNVISVKFTEGLFDKGIIETVYVITVIFSFEALLILLSNSFKVSRGKPDVLGMIYTLFILIYILTIAVATQFTQFNKPTNFFVIVIFIILLFIPMFTFLFNVINTVQNKMANVFLGIFIIYIFQVYIYLLFGSYNLQLNKEMYDIVSVSSNFEGIIKVIQIGSTYIYSYPSVFDKIEYFLQFFIGNAYNLIVIGIFVSYFSKYISIKSEA